MEQRTPRNITPAFPKGNMGWEKIWGEVDFLCCDSLPPQFATLEVFYAVLLCVTPNPKNAVFLTNKGLIASYQLTEKVTYVSRGSNWKTLQIQPAVLSGVFSHASDDIPERALR